MKRKYEVGQKYRYRNIDLEVVWVQNPAGGPQDGEVTLAITQRLFQGQPPIEYKMPFDRADVALEDRLEKE